MEIPPVTIKFTAAPALAALTKLADAALESPEIISGIAKLEEPLFAAVADTLDFANPDDRNIEVTLIPTDRLKQFLRGLGKLPRQP